MSRQVAMRTVGPAARPCVVLLITAHLGLSQSQKQQPWGPHISLTMSICPQECYWMSRSISTSVTAMLVCCRQVRNQSWTLERRLLVIVWWTLWLVPASESSAGESWGWRQLQNALRETGWGMPLSASSSHPVCSSAEHSSEKQEISVRAFLRQS